VDQPPLIQKSTTENQPNLIQKSTTENKPPLTQKSLPPSSGLQSSTVQELDHSEQLKLL
jgi:hypothetical protein